MNQGLHSGEDSFFWEKFVSGNDEAYAYFYRKYAATLYSYGMRFTSNGELVKDCIHDVFVKLYGRRAKLSHVNQVQAYLLGALKNELYTIFRKDKTAYCIDSIEPVFCIDYTAEERLIAEEQEVEEQQRLRRILDTLSPRQKEVIYYRFIRGMELEEICKLMGVNYQSLQNLIQRSIRKIKTTFDETGHALRQPECRMNIIKQRR